MGALLVVAAPPGSAAPGVVYRIADPRIDEASGLGVGVRSPGVDYVQNDSGDTARFFAVSATTGRTAAVVTVPGATNVDWEDLAVAPDRTGTPSVWLADTGDNDAVRSEVRLYRVDEPRVPAGAQNRAVRTGRPDVWRLRYPSGPVDAESLAVSPQGTAYLITKTLGSSTVYQVPSRPDADRVQTLVAVGTVTFTAHPTSIPLGELGTVTATGAALSRDGTLLAVRTYADAYLWSVRDGDVASALRRAPTRVPLPVQRQGEGIAFRGDDLLVDSEGVDQPVYAVPVPQALTRPSATSTAATSTAAPSTTSSSPRPPDTSTSGGSGSGSARTRDVVVGGAVAVAVGVALTGVGVVRRRRRAR